MFGLKPKWRFHCCFNLLGVNVRLPRLLPDSIVETATVGFTPFSVTRIEPFSRLAITLPADTWALTVSKVRGPEYGLDAPIAEATMSSANMATNMLARLRVTNGFT